MAGFAMEEPLQLQTHAPKYEEIAKELEAKAEMTAIQTQEMDEVTLDR
jgi:hypothetical protein